MNWLRERLSLTHRAAGKCLWDSFVPEAMRSEPELLRRSRLQIRFGWLGAIFGSVFAVFYLAIGHWWGAEIVILCSVVFACIPGLLKRQANLHLTGHIFALILLSGFSGLCAVEGGLHGHAIAWLASVPLCVLLLMEMRGALLWSTLCLLVAVTFGLMELMGRSFPKTYDAKWENLLDFFGYCSLVPFMGMLGIIFERTRARAFMQLENTMAELSVANQRLRKVSEDKSEFLKIAAHDLKNPLAAISGYAELLTLTGMPSFEAVQEASTTIRGQSKRMLGIISNLLDVQRIEEGSMKLKLVKCSIERLTQEMVKTYVRRAEKKSIQLNLVCADSMPSVTADESAVDQILDNLISNAIIAGSSLPAAAGTKPSAPAPHAAAPAAHSAPATHSAPAAHPAGGGSAAGHSPTTAGHTTTTTAGHGATTTTAGHGATTTTAGHGATTTTAGHGATTTTAGSGHVGGAGAAGAAGHAATAGGAAGMHGGAAGNAPHGTTASHSAITHPVPRGTTEHVAHNGSAVRTRADGHVADVHDARRGMDVHHGLDGGRRVSHEMPNHGRMYAERGRRGYVQRGYGYHGHDYGRRAYYYHGHEYNRYYRGYGYRGVYLNVYAPGYYYGPGFYGWAYNPWAAPIAFGWGWAGSPWYGFYGGYFNPYPVYASAAFWLTDYIISQDLQAAYAARQEAAVEAGAAIAAGGPPALTPEVKQQIADEVKAQIALENAEAQQTAQNQDVDPGSSGVARMLADGHPHVFVVGSGLDLTDSTGAECAVSEGDALQLVSPPPADATTADLVVLASKGGKECQKTSTVAVQLTDLQEMQNHMRETIDLGLKDLQAKQGTGGLPAAPPSAKAPPTESPYAAVAPPPDPKDAEDLQAQAKEADQAEADATGAVAQDSGSPIGAVTSASTPSGPPPSVALGQTTDQVKGILGNPTKTADVGPKTIYYYDGMKVVFKGGKVTDVE